MKENTHGISDAAKLTFYLDTDTVENELGYEEVARVGEGEVVCGQPPVLRISSSGWVAPGIRMSSDLMMPRYMWDQLVIVSQ